MVNLLANFAAHDVATNDDHVDDQGVTMDHVTTETETEMERLRAQRGAFRLRHARGLTTLMAEREDLRGVHALADLVDDAVRWTA